MLVGQIDSVLPARTAVDQIAQTFIGISHVNEDNMGALLVVLTD